MAMQNETVQYQKKLKIFQKRSSTAWLKSLLTTLDVIWLALTAPEYCQWRYQAIRSLAFV